MATRAISVGAICLLLAAGALAAEQQLFTDKSGEEVLEAVAKIEAEYDAGNGHAGPDFAQEGPLALNSVAVIRLTVRYSPQIRRAYERKVAEEARYDFFIYNREAWTYGARTEFDYDRHRDDTGAWLDKTVTPEVFVEKEFYNTARAAATAGYDLNDYQNGHGGNGTIGAEVSVPLFASREALERANQKIYQQTEVNDARLNYYQEIREQVSETLHDLAWAQQNQETLTYQTAYRDDLQKLLEVVDSVKGRDTTADKAKVQATLATACAQCETSRNNLDVGKEWLRNGMGIPFDTSITVAEEEFNPFAEESREELERVAVESNEEIKTLLNSIRNSQAELDLARKGKWDTSLVFEATRDVTGEGDRDGDADYFVGTTVEVTRIDDRISRALEAISLARIRESRNAIVDRRRSIHSQIVESYTQLKSRAAEVATREANLQKYVDDYANGIELYKAGTISIDEVIQKRETLKGEQSSIFGAKDQVRDCVTDLLSSTGRYEQFLEPGALNGGATSGAPARPEDAPPAPGAVRDTDSLLAPGRQ